MWSHSDIDKEAFKKQSEDLLQNAQKMLKQAQNDLATAESLYKTTKEELIQTSVKTDFPNKHRELAEVKHKYNDAVQYHKNIAPREYKDAVAKLREKTTSMDELPWLMKKLKIADGNRNIR